MIAGNDRKNALPQWGRVCSKKALNIRSLCIIGARRDRQFWNLDFSASRTFTFNQRNGWWMLIAYLIKETMDLLHVLLCNPASLMPKPKALWHRSIDYRNRCYTSNRALCYQVLSQVLTVKSIICRCLRFRDCSSFLIQYRVFSQSASQSSCCTFLGLRMTLARQRIIATIQWLIFRRFRMKYWRNHGGLNGPFKLPSQIIWSQVPS